MDEKLARRELVQRGAVGAAAIALSGTFGAAARAGVHAGSRPHRRAARGSSNLVVLEPSIAPGLDWDGRQGTNPGTQELLAQTYDLLIDPVRVPRGPILVPNPSRFQGTLARTWEQRGLEWTFHLRRGVRSAAGNTLTADDVIWTFARAKSVSGASTISWFLGNVASLLPRQGVLGADATPEGRRLGAEVVKIDDYTVKFTQFEPNELFPAVLTVFALYIVDSKNAQKHRTPDDPWAHAWMDTQGSVGFGPYWIKTWRKDEAVTLKANRNYWRGQPEFRSVTISQVPHAATRVAAIISGAADVVSGLSPREFQQVAKSGKANVFNFFGAFNLMLSPNFRIAPWDGGGDARKARLLRQALAYAIPYNEINAKAYAGQARKWESLVTSGFRGARRFRGRYSTDLSKARALLSEAGYPNGRGLDGPGLSLTYIAERQSVLEPVATALRTALRQIGINVELNPIPQVQFSDRKSVKRDLPFFVDSDTITIVADAGYTAQNLFVSTARGGLANATNYASDAFDALYLQQKRSTGRRRLQLLAELQEMMMTDLPRIPILEVPTQVAMRKGLTRWSPRMDKAVADFRSLKRV